MKRALVCAAVALTTFAAQAARADPAKCLDAANEAEKLRKDVTQLTKARDKYRVCAAEECPAAVRADCQKSYAEVEASIPSVLLVAEDGDGNQMFDAAVTVDGAPLVEKLDGKPITLDAGAHTFVFKRAGKTVEVKLVVESGGKNTRVLGRFPKEGAVPFTSPPASASPSSSPLVPIGLVIAGVGVVGLAVGTIFGLSASGQKSDSGCEDNGRCPDDAAATKLKDAQSSGTLSTVFFVTGGVLVAGGLTMVLLAPKSSSSASARVRPWAGPGAGGLLFEGAAF